MEPVWLIGVCGVFGCIMDNATRPVVCLRYHVALAWRVGLFPFLLIPDTLQRMPDGGYLFRSLGSSKSFPLMRGNSAQSPRVFQTNLILVGEFFQCCCTFWDPWRNSTDNRCMYLIDNTCFYKALYTSMQLYHRSYSTEFPPNTENMRF